MSGNPAWRRLALRFPARPVLSRRLPTGRRAAGVARGVLLGIACSGLALSGLAASRIAVAGRAAAQSFDTDGPLILGPIERNPLETLPDGGQEPPLVISPLERSPLTLGPERVLTEETAVEAGTGTGAVVRALDKITGEHADLTVSAGGSARFGRLELRLGECRFPADNPEGDAFAYLVVTIEGQETPVFSGWMIASSPALSAMDHHRYDVWVIRCTTS